MGKATKYNFKSTIYKVDINACVDVPKRITDEMESRKGYIKIKGKINGFGFNKNLVPVKNKPYRLFVNIPMLEGAEVKPGDTANFVIEQDFKVKKKSYPRPKKLTEILKDKKLLDDFNNLTESQKRNILKYLNDIKTEKTLERNIKKLIDQLENKETNIRIP